MIYRPLPDYLTIKDSSIDGQGVFTTEKIESNTIIGITHHANKRSEDGWIRTPLGGFGNHSDDPNCFKLLMDPETWWIGASRDIEPGEELTWKYSLYTPLSGRRQKKIMRKNTTTTDVKYLEKILEKNIQKRQMCRQRINYLIGCNNELMRKLVTLEKKQSGCIPIPVASADCILLE